jgi:signal transduction histidine kinase
VPYRRRKRIIFAEFALIPVFLICAALWMRVQHNEDLRLVDHSREVQGAIADVYALLADTETARRQYVINGDPADLAVFGETARKVAESIQRLERLVADNPTQQQNVRALEQAANLRLDFIRQISEVGRASGGPSAVQAMEKQTGLALSSQIRQAAARLTEEEERLLEARKHAASVMDLWLDILFAAALAFVIGLLLWANRTVKLYARKRDDAEAALIASSRALREKMADLDKLNQQLETRVQERTARLEGSNRDLQHFAFIAGHDLQEPLRMVISYVGLIEEACRGKLDATVDRYLTVAMEGARRMQVLISDILSYTRAGSEELTLVPAQLGMALDQAQYGLTVTIQEVGAQIENAPLPVAEIDVLKMSLVFQNLLSNAIKFHKPGERPRIHIEAGQIRNGRGDEWVISVRDEGIGFDPKYSEKIFEAFQRLHSASKYPGTGIGLAMCRRIIEGHGGRIWAEGRLGQGATFFFSLPARANARSAAARGAR